MENSHRHSSRALLRKRFHLESCFILAHLGGHGKPRKVGGDPSHVSPAPLAPETWALRSVPCEWWSHTPRAQCRAHGGRTGSAGCPVLLEPGALGSGLVWNSRALRNPGHWAVAAYGCDTDASTQTLNLQRRSKDGWCRYPHCSWTWGRAGGRWGPCTVPMAGLPLAEWAHGFRRIAGHFGANKAMVLEKIHTF